MASISHLLTFIKQDLRKLREWWRNLKSWCRFAFLEWIGYDDFIYFLIYFFMLDIILIKEKFLFLFSKFSFLTLKKVWIPLLLSIEIYYFVNNNYVVDLRFLSIGIILNICIITFLINLSLITQKLLFIFLFSLEIYFIVNNCVVDLKFLSIYYIEYLNYYIYIKFVSFHSKILIF